MESTEHLLPSSPYPITPSARYLSGYKCNANGHKCDPDIHSVIFLLGCATDFSLFCVHTQLAVGSVSKLQAISIYKTVTLTKARLPFQFSTSNAITAGAINGVYYYLSVKGAVCQLYSH